MADLVEGLRTMGKKKYRPRKMQEETPEPSIPIDPVLLAESSRQEKQVGLDSDSDVIPMSLALYQCQYTFRVIFPRTLMKTRPTQMTTPKETRVL